MSTDTQQHSPMVISYARALLELASEQNAAEAVNADLQALREALEGDTSFKAFLRDPGISDEQRLKALRSAVGNSSPLLSNFLGVIAQHNRFAQLVNIAEAYEDLLGEQLGKIEVDVIVAKKLDGDQLEKVRQKVSEALKKDAVVHQYVDDSIIGGLILRVQDQMIDASVKSQLNTMKKRLLAARPK